MSTYDDLFAWGEAAAEPAAATLPPPPPPAEPGTGAAPLAGGIMELRDYQEEFKAAVHRRFAKHRRALGVAGTGAGKTVVFAAVIKDYYPRRCLVLTDQQDLVDQTIGAIRELTGIFADVEQGTRTAVPHAKVIVATVQSMQKRIAAGKYAPDAFELVIADECDRAMAPQWQKVLKHFDAHAAVLGVTATPKRTDKKNILSYFEEKVFEITTLELIERKFLVPINVRTCPLKIDITECDDRGGDYKPEELGHAIEAAFEGVWEQIEHHAPDRKIIVFLPDCDTSQQFVGVGHDRRNGFTIAHIDGKAPNRKEIKQAFRDWTPATSRPGKAAPIGAIQVLCNPMLLGRGYDDPSIDCVINLRATKSESFYRQIIGRGTRLFCPHRCKGPCEHPERKRDLLVLDFLWQFKGLGPCRPASLIADTPEKEKAMQEILEETGKQLELRELRELATAKMQAALLKALQDAQKAKGRRKGELFSAYEWAANLGVDDLLDYMPDNPADAAPAKPSVIEKLAKYGFARGSIATAGHAKRILDVIDARREAGLCTFKQILWLRKWGYRNPENLSVDEASEIMDREFAERRGQGGETLPKRNLEPATETMHSHSHEPEPEYRNDDADGWQVLAEPAYDDAGNEIIDPFADDDDPSRYI